MAPPQLHEYVQCGRLYRNLPAQTKCQSDSRVKVRTGYWPHHSDEYEQNGTRGQRVTKQRNGRICTQPISHDARPNDRGKKNTATQCFCRHAAIETVVHLSFSPIV